METQPFAPAPIPPLVQLPVQAPSQARKFSASAIVGIVVVVLALAYAVVAMTMKLWPFAPQESIPSASPSSLVSFSPSPSTSADAGVEWKTYQSEEYGFAVKYPPGLGTQVKTGQNTSWAKRFVTVAFGTSEYLSRRGSSPEGANGVPIFLDVTALEPSASNPLQPPVAQPVDCGEFTATGTVMLGDMAVTKCEGTYRGNPGAMSLTFSKGSFLFSIVTHEYEGADKYTIDQMLATFWFTR